MVDFEIVLNANRAAGDVCGLDIPLDVVEEFLSTGFSEDIYQGKISYVIHPCAVDGNHIEILMKLTEAIEKINVWGNIVRALYRFIEKTPKYEHVIYVKKKEGEKETEIFITGKENEDVAEILEKIEKIL